MAERMGVTIKLGYPPRPDWWGCYDDRRRLITIRPDLGPLQFRSVAWHELGHAHFEHVGCTVKQEREACMWAARHMISAESFVAAARQTDDLIHIAHILGVLPDDVRWYEKSLTTDELLLLRGMIDDGANDWTAEEDPDAGWDAVQVPGGP